MDAEAAKLELCLKCGSQITHVPYQFDGKVFHARCLLCNACGKRLVGKPFITKNRQIFCGEQCKSQFEQGVRPHCLKDPPEMNCKPFGDSFSEGPHSISLDESLTEALEELQEEHSLRLVPGGHDSLRHPPAERVTDYPIGVLPGHSQIHSFETDSVSTFSESSFTSDSSVAYDASRKPKKKILKTSNAAQGRNNKLRVRWKLHDQDDISMSSVTSIRSDSGLLNSHREAARRTLQNWKDFEGPLPPGSSGLTPTKNKFLSKSTNYINPSTQVNRHRPHPLSPPNGLRPGLHQVHPEHPLPSQRGNPSPEYKPHKVAVRHDSAPSDLLSHLAISPHNEEGTPYRLRHARLSPQSQWREEDSSSSILDVSVFQFDEKNLPQLDKSSLDDRKSSHLFEFPKKTSSPLSRTKPTSRKSSTASHDASDYDHLQENEEGRQRAKFSQRNGYKDSPPLRTLKAKDRLAPQAPDKQWYAKEDVEDAQRNLENDHDRKQEEAKSPPLPDKCASPCSSGPGKHTYRKVPAPSSDEGEDYDHLNAPPPLPPKQRKPNHVHHKPPLPPDSAIPPPLPPKKRHSSGSDVPISPVSASDPDKTKTKFHMDIPAATSTPNHPSTTDRSYQMEESIILPPPSEFAGSFTTGTEKGSQRQDFSPSPQLGSLPHSLSCDTLTGSDSPSQPLAREEHRPSSDELDIYPEAAAMATRPALSWSSPPQEEEPVFQVDDCVVEGAEDVVQNPSPVRKFVATSEQPLSRQQQPHVADHPHKHGGSSSLPPRSAWTGNAAGKEHGKTEHQSAHPDNHPHQSVDRYRLPMVDSNAKKKAGSSPDTSHEIRPLSKWFQNNSKPPNKKTPSAAETDPDLRKLLDDLDIDTIMEEASPQHHSGVCCVCHTIIPSTRFLLSHAGKVYHIGCFSCVQCGCPLKGQRIFTLQNGSVLCEEHYRQLLLTQQQQQHAALRRNQQLPYPTAPTSFMPHPPQSNYPYKRLPTKAPNTYTMV